MKLVVILFLSSSAFLGIILPLVLAPIGFYNNFSEITRFVPISIILSIGLAIAGIFYHFYEKRSFHENQKNQNQ